MTVQFPVAIQFTVRCAACGKESEPQKYVLAEGCQIPYPSFPTGWTFVTGVPRCADHVVKITVDSITKDSFLWPVSEGSGT